MRAVGTQVDIAADMLGEHAVTPERLAADLPAADAVLHLREVEDSAAAPAVDLAVAVMPVAGLVAAMVVAAAMAADTGNS
jgi:hypothetical protein